MTKEVFVAVTVGFILGLAITFGIWTANKSFSSPKTIAVSPTPVITPTPNSQTSPISLILTSPTDESVQNSDTVTFSGKTSPGAAVAVSYESGETIITADSSGNFTKDLKLDSGYNRFSATAFDAAGNSATQNILVTYSTSKI